MAIGSWKSPFPLRFGGGATRTVDTFYKIMQASRPDILRGGEGTEVDVENKAAARLLAVGWRATERRVAQRNPLALSSLQTPVTFPDGTTESLSMLERWERILHLTPRLDESEQARRAAVASALLGQTSTNLRGVTDAMRAIFGSWLVSITENHVEDVDYSGKSPAGSVVAHWGTNAFVFSAEYPGSYDADYPWYSGVEHICVNIQPPDAVAQDEIDTKASKALAVLDDMLPARMSATISQLAPDQANPGFFLNVSFLNLTAL